jgi:hypothetical protein
MAGALALATVAACLTAIAMTDRRSDDRSPSPQGQAAGTDPTGPGLISFATPSTSGAATPGRKSDAPDARTTTKAPSPHGSPSATPPAEPPKPPTARPSSPDEKPEPPATTWRSVRSVNYPDRYWHVSGSGVRLDPIRSASARQDATFELVKGLADASCYSFATADGTYLRHRNFVLRAEGDDGSSLFDRDATFCPRGASASDAIMLESVNYPGRFLRHKDFTLRLESYQHSGLYQADSAFRLVDGLA